MSLFFVAWNLYTVPQGRYITEDGMVGWHHQFNGHELGQTLEGGEEQGGLSWGSP